MQKNNSLIITITIAQKNSVFFEERYIFSRAQKSAKIFCWLFIFIVDKKKCAFVLWFFCFWKSTTLQPQQYKNTRRIKYSFWTSLKNLLIAKRTTTKIFFFMVVVWTFSFWGQFFFWYLFWISKKVHCENLFPRRKKYLLLFFLSFAQKKVFAFVWLFVFAGGFLHSQYFLNLKKIPPMIIGKKYLIYPTKIDFFFAVF